MNPSRTACTAAAIIAATATFAHADIVSVDEFESINIEGFQNLDMTTFHSGTVEIFGGMGQMFNSSGSWLHTTGAWSYKQRVAAYEGSRLLGTSRGGVSYQFNSQQHAFGGFFASISDAQGGQIQFYNGNELVGSDALTAPTDTSWAWNGWSSDNAFDRVVVSSNDARGGFLMHDAVRTLATQVPSPGAGVLLVGGMLTMTRRRR